MNKNIENFYTQWMANLPQYLRGYAYHQNGEQKKTRFAFLLMEKYLHKLADGTLSDNERIIILPGIRGVGKTTLLAQSYFAEDFISKAHHKVKDKLKKIDYKIYISADRLLAEEISLKDFFAFIEKIVLSGFLKDKKILFLIDEIQYDRNWALFLKLIYDQTKGNPNILVFATGSSAVFLNKQNTDLVRRSIPQRILPEKFIEYLMLHHNTYPLKGLRENIHNAIFYSKSAQEVFDKLQNMQSLIIAKLSSIPNLDKKIEDYFLCGAFPFSAEMEAQSLAMERIKNMVLINVIQKDLIELGDFDGETLIKIPDILFLLANSDEVSVGKLASDVNIHSRTLNKVLDALVKTELLLEIKPYGNPHAQVRKSSKFLFVSSNIRAGLLNGFISPELRGKFLEDYTAFIFEKEFKGKADVLFDYSKGGADFVLRFINREEMVFEVGMGKEKTDQVEHTMKKTDGRAKYGIVIGSQELELNGNVVKIPLNYFLLI